MTKINLIGPRWYMLRFGLTKAIAFVDAFRDMAKQRKVKL